MAGLPKLQLWPGEPPAVSVGWDWCLLQLSLSPQPLTLFSSHRLYLGNPMDPPDLLSVELSASRPPQPLGRGKSKSLLPLRSSVPWQPSVRVLLCLLLPPPPFWPAALAPWAAGGAAVSWPWLGVG